MPNAMLKTGCGEALKLHRRATFGEVSNRARPRANPTSTAPGSEPASAPISNLIIGGSADSAVRRGRGRGGARNHKHRTSLGLSPQQVSNLVAAAAHAASIGLPFTRMVTIHWQAAGLPLSAMATATGRFLDLLTKALARHGSRTTWIWVHENGDEKGGHCHLLFHVPAGLVDKLNRLSIKWLGIITGRPYRARVIRSRPIGGRLGIEVSQPELHRVNVDAAMAYVLKGATPVAGKLFGLDRLDPGGLVVGRRCSTSQNIGAKAQKERM